MRVRFAGMHHLRSSAGYSITLANPRLTASRRLGNVIALARSGEDFERQGRSVAMDLLSTFVRSDASGARPRSTLPTTGPS